MVRWVIQGEKELEIVTTSGFEPDNALCKCEDHWTIYNISYNKSRGVYFDPERELFLQKEREAEALKKKITDIKVEFVEQTNSFIHWFLVKRFNAIELALIFLVGIVGAWFHFRGS